MNNNLNFICNDLKERLNVLLKTLDKNREWEEGYLDGAISMIEYIQSTDEESDEWFSSLLTRKKEKVKKVLDEQWDDDIDMQKDFIEYQQNEFLRLIAIKLLEDYLKELEEYWEEEYEDKCDELEL